MSSSGGKGGSQKTKNYYGTVTGAVGWGPWDWISAIIHNGNYLFQGNLVITEDVTDLTGAIADPSYIAPGGWLKFHRGTETQPADSSGRRHKGTALIDAKRIFFGQSTGSAPNLQIIGGGLPRVHTSIVAAVDNVADDGQINPVAAMAEILLDERGAGLDIAQLDAASWLAAAHWAYLNKDYTFCSPLITEQGALRELAKQLLEPFNGFCRWTNSGKLACHVYEWGVDPGGLQLLDANHWTKRPRFSLGDWSEVKTELLISFTDRDFEYQDNSLIVPNSRAQKIRQVDDQGRMERRHITRHDQAFRHGSEYNRRMGTAPSTVPIYIRQPFVTGLSVGDKIKVDTDPEPGGAGLAQVCRIERIEQDQTDEAKLVVITDNLLPANSYGPATTPPEPVTEESPPLEHFLAVPLPPNYFSWPLAVGLLTARPDARLIGFGVYFGPSADGSFADLGQQIGFAVRAQLSGAIDADDTALDLTELDGLDAPDAGLAALTPGGNATQAANNTLLVLLAQLDGSGRIALGGDGDPVMEFLSVVDRGSPVDATHTYTVLRGRLGTTARVWADDTVAWIIPQQNLESWRHDSIPSLLGTTAYMRLVSFTPRAVDDSTPVPQCGVNLPPATAPFFARIGSRTYRQAAAPTGDLLVGDLWFDTDDGNRQYRWNGAAWVDVSDSRIVDNDTVVRALIAEVGRDMAQMIALTNEHANALLQEFSSRDVAIANEASTRAAAIIAEAAARGTAITNEQTVRQAADVAETNARTTADSVLQSDINTRATAASLTAESSTRAAADTAETAARTTADSALQTNINSVSASLATESSTRVTQVDALARDLSAMLALFNDSVASLYQEFQVRAAVDTATASSITTLNASVGTLNSTVNVMAAAYVVGGVAIATWGFKLDGGGKVVGMQAIAASGGTQAETGVIVFSGADLRSDNYTQDGGGVPTAGWKLEYGGVLKAVAALLRNADIIGTLRVGTIIEAGVISDAPLPDFDDAGSPDIEINAPASPPTGYNIRYQVGTSGWLSASSFPFTVSMGSASTWLHVEAYAPGRLPSGQISESWNSLFL